MLVVCVCEGYIVRGEIGECSAGCGFPKSSKLPA